jgi:hypothetical protein
VRENNDQIYGGVRENNDQIYGGVRENNEPERSFKSVEFEGI